MPSLGGRYPRRRSSNDDAQNSSKPDADWEMHPLAGATLADYEEDWTLFYEPVDNYGRAEVVHKKSGRRVDDKERAFSSMVREPNRREAQVSKRGLCMTPDNRLPVGPAWCLKR
jgi:hypothetical protein